ncbi:hypothetical protein VB713_28155 [Anabaena cylindrica UHCC 0172]|uniref:hypothetical protein n=1 Tax=Anabaena cylindrica TaxID=1165 RepID=UPI002B1EE3D8|nr:hypothetical protein [Anabaena cylindrica]MEA5554802.1 hypothetical protein [Anabaena cylindrica UHCC 0172]
MVDRINDIAWQAHQGSVAAIIQLLNEKLVMSGVRTRAIFADGVLQLLCEAATVEQLEQSTLVQRIQHILDSTAPRNIRKVNINSRIVREEQLLWLEEINRDRENQLLWSEEITLVQPGIIKQLIQDLTAAYAESGKPILPKGQSLLSTPYKYQTSTKKVIVGAAGLCTVLLVAWLINFLMGSQIKSLIPLNISPSLKTENELKSQVSPDAANKSLPKSSNDSLAEPFADAVRLANQASAAGKTATTATQWLELAAKWQRASDLMSQVPSNHSRYQEAQIRTKLYKKYSETAQQEAEKIKS